MFWRAGFLQAKNTYHLQYSLCIWKIMSFINNSKDVEYYEVKKYNTRDKNGMKFLLMG